MQMLISDLISARFLEQSAMFQATSLIFALIQCIWTSFQTKVNGTPKLAIQPVSMICV
jgi:hypothetical protein